MFCIYELIGKVTVIVPEHYHLQMNASLMKNFEVFDTCRIYPMGKHSSVKQEGLAVARIARGVISRYASHCYALLISFILFTTQPAECHIYTCCFIQIWIRWLRVEKIFLVFSLQYYGSCLLSQQSPQNAWDDPSPLPGMHRDWPTKGVDLTGLLGDIKEDWGPGGQKSPSGVQGRSPGSGSGGPEAFFLKLHIIFALKYNKQQLLLLLDKMNLA